MHFRIYASRTLSIYYAPALNTSKAFVSAHAGSPYFVGFHEHFVKVYREQMMRSICDSLRKTANPLCGLLALTVSSCGGGGGGIGAQPLTVTAKTLYSFGGTSTDAMGPGGVLVQGSDG